MTSALKIIRYFDEAASRYDAQASLQAQVAENLLCWAAPHLQQPQDILDIGCGTGFVTAALHKQWPDAALTAVDQSPRMLRQAEQKVRHLRTIRADAFTIEFTQKFDALFSSMMLHWLPDPREALQRWQCWLKPNGTLFVALLIEGSFQEWRDLCAAHNIKDGLWPMPPADFANPLMPCTNQQKIVMTYPTARDFLLRLKATGTATPRKDHEPLGTAAMRGLLREAPQPFPVTYNVLYIVNSPQGSV